MPYSSAYDARFVFDGSLPSLRTGAKPHFRRSAIAEPKMNPRLSMPTTRSIFSGACGAAIASTAMAKPSRSFSNVVTS